MPATAATPALSLNRRSLLAGAGALGLSACMHGPQRSTAWQHRFALIEQNAGGPFGACIFNTATGRSIGWRENERFGHCSSFKLSLAAMALRLAQDGALSLGERLSYTAADLLDYAPVTQKHVETGMTIGELAHAAQVFSDNTAANLLLRRFGGPERLTAFWRDLGDTVSRLDRYEPDLNVVPAGELRDTTTPAAMARTLAALFTGPVLQQDARDRLIAWTIETQTGSKRIRAGLPQDWTAGDKTGSGGTLVDVAWVTPPQGAMLIVTGYIRPMANDDAVAQKGNDALAELGRVVAEWASGTGARP